MKKQIVAEITGYTPVPDVLTKKYGPVTAHVFGVIWRFSQMEDEVCRASLTRIGSDIGISGRTVQNHIKVLEDGGYIKDLTPNQRNEPHKYQDTGKIKMKMWSGMVETVGKNFQPRLEETSIEESTTTGEVIQNIFTMYQSNIAMLTPIMADTLQDAEKEYPVDWIYDAIALAVTNNKRNWKYCEAILKRWKTDGKDSGKKEQPQQEMVRLL
jgi:DnaD/phage-associated family protein